MSSALCLGGDNSFVRPEFERNKVTDPYSVQMGIIVLLLVVLSTTPLSILYHSLTSICIQVLVIVWLPWG